MKRFVAWLLVFVCTAGAETVRERVAAPDHLQTVFASNTGRTAITVNATVDSAEDIYADRQFPYETLFVIITPEGRAKWCCLSPYQIGETLAEDTQLLTFDEIIGIAKTLLPLSLQFQEKYLEAREQDKVRYTVNRITFGYTRVKQRNNPDECMLVPCWDFFNAEQADESLLTINAVDGTVIDRDYGY